MSCKRTEKVSKYAVLQLQLFWLHFIKSFNLSRYFIRKWGTKWGTENLCGVQIFEGYDEMGLAELNRYL